MKKISIKNRKMISVVIIFILICLILISWIYQCYFKDTESVQEEKEKPNQRFVVPKLPENRLYYNGTEIKNRIIDGSTNYVVRYPLITRRYLTYQDGGVNDISPTGSSEINYTELFPAIRIAAIFGAIQGRYGLTFQGTFLLDKRFQNAFLLCQNENDFEYVTEAFDLSYAEIAEIARNSFTSSFASDTEKANYLKILDLWLADNLPEEENVS